MGANEGLPCSIEGERSNETPVRVVEVPPFYISKNTVTNIEFEEFDKRHSRTNTSRGDRNPVTCLTYGRAISYILWLNERTGLSFRLPTEPEYVAAVAPYGWQFPYKENGHPSRKSQNHFRAFPELYPDGELGSTVQVDDPIVPPNYLGLNHPTGNVSIFSFGHYSTEGHWGANSDGSYVVILGGNFRLCPFSTRSLSRGILDVTGVADTVGIRLVHPDPEYLLDSMGKS
jgi:formylglycine-generating enzyme required for sulfatase activity